MVARKIKTTQTSCGIPPPSSRTVSLSRSLGRKKTPIFSLSPQKPTSSPIPLRKTSSGLSTANSASALVPVVKIGLTERNRSMKGLLSLKSFKDEAEDDQSKQTYYSRITTTSIHQPGPVVAAAVAASSLPITLLMSCRSEHVADKQAKETVKRDSPLSEGNSSLPQMKTHIEKKKKVLDEEKDDECSATTAELLETSSELSGNSRALPNHDSDTAGWGYDTDATRDEGSKSAHNIDKKWNDSRHSYEEIEVYSECDSDDSGTKVSKSFYGTDGLSGTFESHDRSLRRRMQRSGDSSRVSNDRVATAVRRRRRRRGKLDDPSKKLSRRPTHQNEQYHHRNNNARKGTSGACDLNISQSRSITSEGLYTFPIRKQNIRSRRILNPARLPAKESRAGTKSAVIAEPQGNFVGTKWTPFQLKSWDSFHSPANFNPFVTTDNTAMPNGKTKMGKFSKQERSPFGSVQVRSDFENNEIVIQRMSKIKMVDSSDKKRLPRGKLWKKKAVVASRA